MVDRKSRGGRTDAQRAADKAEDALREHRRSMLNDQSAREIAAINAIRNAIESEYGEELRRLTAAAVAAREAELAEREQLAPSKAPYPIGTILIGWERQGRSRSQPRPWAIFGKGVVEMVTRSTVHPESLAICSRAEVGEFIVRLLKKDGTPGIKYERLDSDWQRARWLPEGKRPKE